MKCIDRVEVAESSADDPIFKYIKKTFQRRHAARRNNDARLATLEGYLEMYPFMDNSRCIDYEGICALKCFATGANVWLKKDELHMQWMQVGATLFALMVQEDLMKHPCQVVRPVSGRAS